MCESEQTTEIFRVFSSGASKRSLTVDGAEQTTLEQQGLVISLKITRRNLCSFSCRCEENESEQIGHLCSLGWWGQGMGGRNLTGNS